MRRSLPVWLLGLTNLPLGVTGAVGLLVAPEVLASRHVPETTIANVTALQLAGTFIFFLIAPVLDVQFSRRTYAIGLTIAAAALTFVTVLSFSNVAMLGLWLFLIGMIARIEPGCGRRVVWIHSSRRKRRAAWCLVHGCQLRRLWNYLDRRDRADPSRTFTGSQQRFFRQ